MKNSIHRILFLFTVLCSMHAFSQEVPVMFSKKGYIEKIDLTGNRLLINFVEEKSTKGGGKTLSKDIVFLSSKTLVVDPDRKNTTITDLKTNSEVFITGKQFLEERRILAEKITIISDRDKNNSINEGRIDFITKDIAYIDGRRVKLEENKKVKGEGAYAPQTFDSIRKLNAGMIADLSGSYKDGAFVASSFSVTPQMKTENDTKAEAIDIEEYNKLAPIWNDKVKRTKVFHNEIDGVGKISDNAEIQEYVNAFGQKLVPAHLRKKVNFIFVVIENPDVNATVHANGLAYVYTGLLKILENEAQFAAVLGHEIAHTMYKHSSKAISDDEVAGKKTTTVGKINIGLKTGYQKAKKHLVKDESKAEILDAATTVVSDNVETVAGSVLQRQLSNFSIKEESQADRVGLCIMAMAGYDPREAPKVWKNIYAKYGITEKKPGVSLADYALEQAAKEEAEKKAKAADKDSTAKEETTASLAAEAADFGIKYGAKNNEAKSTETHPGAVERFEALNRLVALYWNDDALLGKAVMGSKEYAAMVKKLRK